jgi:hypothetical protein
VRARRRWTPTLLSALVFPGLGQMASGRYLAGLAFGLTSLALLGVVLQRVWVDVQARIPADPDELLRLLADQPVWPLRLAAEIQHDDASFFVWATVALLAIWALSVWDAWRAGRAAH